MGYTIVVELRANGYYVYTHNHNGKVFYVGMGKNHRGFDLADLSRGNSWKEYVKTNPNFTIKVLKQFSDRDEALKYETKKIKELRPVGNKQGLGRLLVKYRPSKDMNASEMGKRGAKVTNSLLTKEGRAKAAKKGWRLRKARLKELSQGN